MRFTCLLCLASIALAAGIEVDNSKAEDVCGDSCVAEASRTKASSLLQHSISKEDQRLEHDKRRRMRKATDYLLQRRLILLAGLIEEGLDQADAIALMRSFAGEDWANVDLSTTASQKEVYQEQSDAVHAMLCHVREGAGKDDCEQEWQEVFNDALNSISSITTSLLQKVAGWKVEKKAMPTRQGSVDPKLLQLADAQFIAMMKLMVSSGSQEAAVKQLVIDVVNRVVDMDDSHLLTYVGKSKAELAYEYVASVINHICLPNPDSCDEILAKKVSDVLDETTAGALLQIGIRPAAQVVTKLMRLMGVLEHPEKSA